MATSLDKLENKVQIHHLHVKCFHMVKILRKSVQYVRRYSTNTPVFWSCRTWRSQMSSIICGVTRQKFTKFLHDIATSSPLLVRTFRQWYCNSFSDDSAKNACAISRRSWHFPKINWLSWQRPSINRKTGIDLSSALKALSCGENTVKIGQHILRYLTKYASFWPCRKKVYKWAPFSLELLDQRSRNFTRYRGIICAVNADIQVAISFWIDRAIVQGVRNFAPFLPLNWLPWQRPLRNWKNWTRSRKFTQIPSIWWKDRENPSSRYWGSFAHSKKNNKKLTQAKYKIICRAG